MCVCVAYRQVVDSHAADGAAVVAEVVLDGRVGHLDRREEEHEEEKLFFQPGNPINHFKLVNKALIEDLFSKNTVVLSPL